MKIKVQEGSVNIFKDSLLSWIGIKRALSPYDVTAQQTQQNIFGTFPVLLGCTKSLGISNVVRMLAYATSLHFKGNTP